MGINPTQTSELQALREAIAFLELVQMIEDVLMAKRHSPPDNFIGSAAEEQSEA